jgi:hypothetical protein
MRATFLSALVLIGCVGKVGTSDVEINDDDPDPKNDNDSPPTTESQARMMFVAEVHPIMAKCSGGACHSIDAVSASLSHFYTTDANQTYEVITVQSSMVGTFQGAAPILTKIAPGNHNGMQYSTAEQDKITGWLAQETTERAATPGGQDPPKNPNDPLQLLASWTGCMTLDNFEAADMPIAWGTLNASGQKCANCHGTGGEGFIATIESAVFFKAVSEQQIFLSKYFSVDTLANKVIINTGSFENAGVYIISHPRFNPTENAGMIALKEFYDLTAAAQAAGTCGPPTLIVQ